MKDSRANWFVPARYIDGPEKKCLSCKKPFRNGPGEDFRLCRDHRRNSAGVGGRAMSCTRASIKRVSA